MANDGNHQAAGAGEGRAGPQGTPAASPAASPGPSGDALLRSLLASGQLTVDRKLVSELDDGRILAIVRVDLAPGVTEPRHTHPGPELLYGLAGSGVVELDRREHRPITPDTVVRVEPGRVKALRNASGSERLSGLAVMILARDRPPLTTVD